jgi:hypothetical protein
MPVTYVGYSGHYPVFSGATLVFTPGVGTYQGLTFMKNVFAMTRDYWDTSLSTPYKGQLFPTGGNSGGPGQVFPY